MFKSFYQEEPIYKCMGVCEDNGPIDILLRRLMNKYFVEDPIQKNDAGTPCSIIVRTVAENRIVACRMGAIYKKEEIVEGEKSFVDRILETLPSYLLPRKLIFMNNLTNMLADMKFSKKDAFEQLKDSGDLIYFDI